MAEITFLGAAWFIVTAAVGAIMFAAQIGPKAAASNLSDWATSAGLKSPKWLLSPNADRAVRYGGTLVLAILAILGVWIFWSLDAAVYTGCAELIGFLLFALQRRSRNLGIALTLVSFVALGIGIWIVVSAKPEVIPGHAASAATVNPSDIETHISLKFISGPPTANHLSNIWRWYALANVVVVVSPEGRKEVRTWSVFLTFDKPVNVGQVVVSSQSSLPDYEVKDRESRSAVIAFMGDLKNLDLEIKVLNSVPTIPPKPAAPEVVTSTTPALAPAPEPAPPAKPTKSAKSHYETEEIGLMLGVLRKWSEIIDKKCDPASLILQQSSHGWETKIRNEGPASKIGDLKKARVLAATSWTEIRKIMDENQYYLAELQPIYRANADANAEIDDALKRLIESLEEMAKFPGIDAVKYLDPTFNKVQAISTSYQRWIGTTRASILSKTKELREWKNP